MTDEPNTAEVTQADRNFVADYLKAGGRITDRDHERICQGLWDQTAYVLDAVRFRLASRPDDRPTSVGDKLAIAQAIADGFSDGNEHYDEATQDQRERYDMAADAVLAAAPAMPDDVVERTKEGEAMICLGCGSTRTLAYLRAKQPGTLSCCPERKMVPAREVWELACEPVTADDAVERAARAMCDSVNGIGDFDENIAQRRAGWQQQARVGIAAYLATNATGAKP